MRSAGRELDAVAVPMDSCAVAIGNSEFTTDNNVNGVLIVCMRVGIGIVRGRASPYITLSLFLRLRLHSSLSAIPFPEFMFLK